MPTPYEQLGGEPVLRLIIDRFVDRVFADRIIGFFFEGKDRARIKAHEFEHAARTLGAAVAYTGRPVGVVHPPLRINAGQFRRRLAILRQEIERAGVSAEITELWINSEQRLLSVVTDGTDCV